MTTEKDRARLQKLLGSRANAVHRDPNRVARSGSDRNSPTGNSEKRSAWAAGGKLISGDDKKIVSLQFTFKEPGAHIIQFNFTAPVDDPAVTYGAAVKCEALITWETNGNTVTRRVSVADGVSVQGSGESVKVVVYDTTNDGPSIVLPADLGREYSVTSSVGPGTRGSFSNPPVLVEGNQAISIPAGASHSFAIPEDAGANSVLVSVAVQAGTPLPEQGVQVQQLTGGSSPVALQWYDPRAFAFCPLVPGSNSILVFNRSLVGIFVQAVWGIDG